MWEKNIKHLSKQHSSSFHRFTLMLTPPLSNSYCKLHLLSLQVTESNPNLQGGDRQHRMLGSCPQEFFNKCSFLCHTPLSAIFFQIFLIFLLSIPALASWHGSPMGRRPLRMSCFNMEYYLPKVFLQLDASIHLVLSFLEYISTVVPAQRRTLWLLLCH